MKLQILIPSLVTTAGMPLIGLVGCSCSNNSLCSVSLESDGMLDLSNNEGVIGQPFFTIISHADGYDDGNWIIPENKIYYEVTVDGKTCSDYEITKIPGPSGDQFDYKMLIYIPKDEVGKNIRIKVKPYCKYLTFTSDNHQQSMYFYNIDSPVELHYSYDLSIPQDDWQVWSDNSSLPLSPNQSLYVYNSRNSFSTQNNQPSFTSPEIVEGKIYCSGNIMSLLNFGNITDYCFNGVFNNFKKLASAPTLPATELADYCYLSMFSNTSIEKIFLPSTELMSYCYAYMFAQCENIKYIKTGFGTHGSRTWPTDSTASWLDNAKNTNDCTFIWHGSKDGPENRDDYTVLSNWKIETW